MWCLTFGQPYWQWGGGFHNVTTKNAKIFIFFVMDKFTGVLQMSVITDFIFITTKISLLQLRNEKCSSSFPANFLNKIPLFIITNCKTLFCNICNFFFSLTSKQTSLLRSAYRISWCSSSELSTVTELFFIVFFLKCFPWIFPFTLLSSLVFNFTLLWCSCYVPSFSTLQGQNFQNTLNSK